MIVYNHRLVLRFRDNHRLRLVDLFLLSYLFFSCRFVLYHSSLFGLLSYLLLLWLLSFLLSFHDFGKKSIFNLVEGIVCLFLSGLRKIHISSITI